MRCHPVCLLPSLHRSCDHGPFIYRSSLFLLAPLQCVCGRWLLASCWYAYQYTAGVVRNQPSCMCSRCAMPDADKQADAAMSRVALPFVAATVVSLLCVAAEVAPTGLMVNYQRDVAFGVGKAPVFSWVSLRSPPVVLHVWLSSLHSRSRYRCLCRLYHCIAHCRPTGCKVHTVEVG